MKATDILKRFDAFLNKEEAKEVKLDKATLENGTIIEAEEFKEGEAVFIVTEDEKVPLPIGDYDLEDGSVLVVTEEGVIGAVKEEEEEVVEEEEVEVEAEAEVKEPKKVVESTVKETHFEEEVKSELEEEVKEVEFVTKEEFSAIVGELKALIDSLKSEETEELSEEISEEEKEELKAELSQAAAKPLVHNPEAKNEKTNIKFSKIKGGTLHSVMSRISNIK